MSSDLTFSAYLMLLICRVAGFGIGVYKSLWCIIMVMYMVYVYNMLVCELRVWVTERAAGVPRVTHIFQYLMWPPSCR